MAAGDLTRDTGSPVMGGAGNMNILTGTIEVDATHRAFAVLPTSSFIVSCTLDDIDGAGSAECDINEDGAGTATNGSLGVNGNHTTVNTYRYRIDFI